MPKLYPEALLFCLLWAALAFVGATWLGTTAGIVLALGLILLVMPVSMVILSRTDSFAAERGVRWSILAVAALAMAAAAGKLF